MGYFHLQLQQKDVFLQIAWKSFSVSHSKIILFATFLTINFVVSNMQQNQTSLNLLNIAGNKNSCFNDNLEKTFCAAAF